MRRTMYTEDHEEFRSAVQEFIRREVEPHVEDWAQAHAISRDSGLPPASKDCSDLRSRSSMAGLARIGIENDRPDGHEKMPAVVPRLHILRFTSAADRTESPRFRFA